MTFLEFTISEDWSCGGHGICRNTRARIWPLRTSALFPWIVVFDVHSSEKIKSAFFVRKFLFSPRFLHTIQSFYIFGDLVSFLQKWFSDKVWNTSVFTPSTQAESLRDRWCLMLSVISGSNLCRSLEDGTVFSTDSIHFLERWSYIIVSDRIDSDKYFYH